VTSSDWVSGLKRAKRVARRLVDRVAEPYVDESVRRVVESLAHERPETPPPAPPVVLHNALHEARSIALGDMPPGAQVLLSAGANGLWYFEWFDQEYGPVKHHIGVEAYMPRPDGLPDNVEWVEADLAAPEGVAAVETGSVDLVFSGQNIEHLWPDQTVAFLVESNRVLRDDGLLVVDSPNRALTEAYQWSMAEHTVELEPSEAVTLLELAGFAVERLKGLWLCREAGCLLPLDPSPAMWGPGGYARRIASATAYPEDSFVWWAEARKVGPPDPDRLRHFITGIFESAWAERVARIRPLGGTEVVLDDGSPGVLMPRGTEGYALTGPYMALPPGTYDFTMPVQWSGNVRSHAPVCRLELVADNELVGASDTEDDTAHEGRATLSCTVTFDALRFAVHARLWCSGTADVRAPLSLTMSPEPWPS
jgi:Methyltransferase domain